MTKPNIIVCMCDQLRPFELGCYGGDIVKTPHIDALASESLVFENAISNNPVCVPARSIMLSGQYSRTCGGSVNNEHTNNPLRNRNRLTDPTIAECFRDMGYTTSMVGKWHTYINPLDCGFEHVFYPDNPHDHIGQTYITQDSEDNAVEGYGPDRELDWVEDFITEDRESPFFLYYNIAPPHMPIRDNVPEKYVSRYSQSDVSLRDNVPSEEQLIQKELWYRIYTHIGFFGEYAKDPENMAILDKYPMPEDFDIKSLTALYYGAIAWVDDLVGRLMKIVKESGHGQDTMIVFTSDHGDNMGSHGIFNKDRLYEESVRIPMIYHYPEMISKGKNKSQLAQIIDIMPTLLDFANGAIPEHVQGKSLLPILDSSKEELDENVAFIETPYYHIGVRTSKFKYGTEISPETRKIMPGNECFYDLEKDPYEKNNLMGSEDYEKEIRVLAEKLEDWDKTTTWLEVNEYEGK